MKITYDSRTRAAYVKLRSDLVFVTRPISDTVLLDLDADANVVGVELLDVDEPVVERIDGQPAAPDARPSEEEASS